MLRAALILAYLIFFQVTQPDVFWLMPDKLFYSAGEEVRVTIQEGENFTGRYLTFEKQNIKKANLYSRTKVEPVLSRFNENAKEHFHFSALQRGTYELHLQTEEHYDRGAESFNQFLKDYDLEEILFARDSKNLLNTNAKIDQVTNNVLLFQVGTELIKKIEPQNYPIEIIPHKNPYTLKKGDPIQFTILAEGKPVFGIRVKIWNRHNNRTTIQNIYTEQDGTIRTHLSSSGPWMVSVVKMNHSKEKENEWKSFQSNLIFGVN